MVVSEEMPAAGSYLIICIMNFMCWCLYFLQKNKREGAEDVQSESPQKRMKMTS